MADLAGFLRARLDEWQAMAEAADTGEPWEAVQHYAALWAVDLKPGAGYLPQGEANQSLGIPDADDWEDPRFLPAWIDHAAHIAASDPSRVLRQVAAMRAILETCAEADGERSMARVVLRQFASIWEGHPDYAAAMSEASHG